MNRVGFGCLRLPKLDPNNDASIDYDKFYHLVDTFLDKGGKYFDTAYTYHDGKSEEAVRRALVERYPRDRFILADKLPSWKVTSYEECWIYFYEQQKRCGVDYFDVYLLHWLNAANYDIAEKYNEFGFLQKLKKEGKAKKIGFSFHDTADLLDRILTEHPEVDYVQLQINYLDWISEAVQAKKCYETAVKHGKKIIVMEPVKGGTLAAIPEAARAVFSALDKEMSPAKWSLRFVHSLPEVEIVLSGMNAMEQINENMTHMPKIGVKDSQAYARVSEMIQESTAVPCTGCGYCVGNCPRQIAIPQYFKLYNEYYRDPEDDWKIKPVYERLTKSHGKASDCIRCQICEKNCPQKIKVTDWLKKVAETMEK